MRTSTLTHFFRTTAFAFLTMAAASPSWAADDVAAAPDSAIDPATETFTKTLKIDDDAPKATRWDVYLSGYAYHDRDTYTKNQLRKMNETTWGGGLGRTLRNERGNDESLYAIGIRDSNRHAQWMAGYAYQWVFPVKSSVEVSAGLTGLLIRRQDWFNGRPFPAILPVASIGSRNARLMATYVPHLSVRNANKGNILQVMLQLSM